MSAIGKPVLTWYASHARPFLEQWSGERLPGLDEEITRLERLENAWDRRFQVCFLGNSGVGKSTLINALVDDRVPVLPQGGVGPLTALATRVRHAPRPYFKVTYHTSQKLNRILFILERQLEMDGELSDQTAASDKTLEVPLDDEERIEANLSAPPLEDPGADATATSIQAYKRVASLLIGGVQFDSHVRDLRHLTAALRKVLGLTPLTEVAFDPSEETRIASLKRALDRARKGETVHVTLDGDQTRFFLSLRDHVAGHMAPLIKTIDVGWHAPVLETGLQLVDLPGLGVANDEYRLVTQRELREARAVVLVVDRSGVTEASADLLRSTGFLNSLLYETANDEAETATLVVAVVKLDLTADDERKLAKQLGEGSGRSWVDHFDDVCVRAESMIRGQLADELSKIVNAGSQVNREDKEAMVERILSSLRIVPVSALEHVRLHIGDEDDRPRIKTAEQSRIPAFRALLSEAARDRNGRVETALRSKAHSLLSRVKSGIEVIQAQWEESSRAEEEAERLRSELEEFLGPKRKRMTATRAEYRAFLRETMKAEIKAAVLEATASARKDIDRYLASLRNYHWSTVRAAVRKGGYHDGAKVVNLPLEFTLRFEEPLAIVWSKKILAPLRKRTTVLGEDYSRAVEEVVLWARDQGARVNLKLVEALSAEIKDQTKQFAMVGREIVNELRDKVRMELAEAIEERVRKSCQKFVADKQAEGTGVFVRMLDFFRTELTDLVVDSAAKVATKVMERNYSDVEAEIQELLKVHPDPLEEAAAQIVEKHEKAVKRSDNKERRRVLEEAASALAAAPLTSSEV